MVMDKKMGDFMSPISLYAFNQIRITGYLLSIM
jgi:hypothetical protein